MGSHHNHHHDSDDNPENGNNQVSGEIPKAPRTRVSRGKHTAVSSSAYGSPVGSRSPGRGASPAFNIRKVPEEAEDTRLLGWVLSVRVTRNVEVLRCVDTRTQERITG